MSAYEQILSVTVPGKKLIFDIFCESSTAM
jgi:hypothetical protein